MTKEIGIHDPYANTTPIPKVRKVKSNNTLSALAALTIGSLPGFLEADDFPPTYHPPKEEKTEKQINSLKEAAERKRLYKMLKRKGAYDHSIHPQMTIEALKVEVKL